MIVIVPVTDDAVPTLLELKDGIAPGDWLTVNSGGVDRPANPANVQARAERLAEAFPQSPIYAFTSGVANVELLSAALHPPIVGIFYDYEPNYPNEPEFSFNPGVTAQNLSKATGIARSHGFRLVAYLTGQGLFNPQHSWNYRGFRGMVDTLVVQTQSALRQNRWTEALDRLGQQFGTEPPTVQITVTPGLPNAVDIPTALGAYDELGRRGFPSVVFWWVPSGGAELRALLDHRRGAPASP
ncbi:MAG TPA: hypothetical protein VK424_07575 [Thermoplasmata archaeon]|nr:hypothetical protein [Thermoplasmata archaeon]